MSRYEKPTPPDRPALRHDDETPTYPRARPIPLREPTRLGEAQLHHGGEGWVSRTEFDALRLEVSRIACDQASMQSVQLADLRTRRKRISDRVLSTITPERAGKVLMAALILAAPAVLERLGWGFLAHALRQIGGEAPIQPPPP